MIEVIAVLSSLLSAWLTARKNIWCWITGIIGIIAYTFIFYEKNDWGNFGLQFIFLIQSFWGWVNWNKNGFIETTRLDFLDVPRLVVGNIIVCFLIYYLSYLFNGNLLVLDAITSGLSLFGMLLLGHNKIEAWILWIIADVLYVIFFILNQLYLSSALYLILLGLAIYGYFYWSKQIKQIKL